MSKITKKKIIEEILPEFAENIIKEYSDIDPKIANEFVTRAYWSGVIRSHEKADFLEWYNNNFKKNLFILDQNDYSEASIDALKILFSLAASDFGSSKQRDLGQIWTDTIRGYLGEIIIRKLFKGKYNCDIFLGHERGDLENYVSKDIHEIEFKNQPRRKPKIKVSIKTLKSNGIWLDFGDKLYKNADVHIACCVGVNINHLFSYFKNLSVFRDKIIKDGIDKKFITEDEGNKIYEEIPSFAKIYGYVPGFVIKKKEYDNYNYKGTKGRIIFNIKEWSGKYHFSYLDEIKKKECAKKVEFFQIKEFKKKENIYVFGLSSLMYTDQDWKDYITNKI